MVKDTECYTKDCNHLLHYVVTKGIVTQKGDISIYTRLPVFAQ